jgi:hypothetical protein
MFIPDNTRLRFPMPPASSIATFHHWLMADPPESMPATTIVLHGSDGRPAGQLAEAIARYLNEFDDESDGHWMAFEPDLIQTIAGNPGDRRLLGIHEGSTNGSATGPVGLREAIRALAQRGHAVLDTPLAAAATRELPGAFHVALGLPADFLDDCHMILNPKRFGPRCLAPVIGDTFLEWSAVRQQQIAAES